MREWHFRVLGMPVAVEPWFWVMALVLGMHLDPRDLLAWIPVVFASVLVHEAGHAMIGRAYGLDPSIRLHALGGVTSWRTGRTLGWQRSILISLAGPGAGFAVAALLLLVGAIAPPPNRFLAGLLHFGVLVNIVWGVLNLLPVLPLDGGQVMRTLVQRFVLRPATELPLQISLGVSGTVAIFGFLRGEFWIAILFGWMGFINYQQLQHTPRYRTR